MCTFVCLVYHLVSRDDQGCLKWLDQDGGNLQVSRNQWNHQGLYHQHCVALGDQIDNQHRPESHMWRCILEDAPGGQVLSCVGNSCAQAYNASLAFSFDYLKEIPCISSSPYTHLARCLCRASHSQNASFLLGDKESCSLMEQSV